MKGIKGQTVWIVFHTFANGHQIEPYEKESEAQEHAAQLMIDYLNNRPSEALSEQDHQALVAWERGDYAEVLKKINVPEIDDHCNVELDSYIIQ